MIHRASANLRPPRCSSLVQIVLEIWFKHVDVTYYILIMVQSMYRSAFLLQRPVVRVRYADPLGFPTAYKLLTIETRIAKIYEAKLSASDGSTLVRTPITSFHSRSWTVTPSGDVTNREVL